MDSKKNDLEVTLRIVTNEWIKGLTGIFVTSVPERNLKHLKKYLPGQTKIHYEHTYENLFSGLIDLIKIQKYLQDFLLTHDEISNWVQCPVSVVLEQIDTHFKNQKKDFYEKLTLPNNTKIGTIKELGDFFKSWRRKNNITEKEIADLSDLKEDFIVQLENGTCNAGISDCLKIISLLGFDFFVVKRSV